MEQKEQNTFDLVLGASELNFISGENALERWINNLEQLLEE